MSHAQIATQETAVIISMADLLAMQAEAVLRAAELKEQIAIAKKQEKADAKQAERLLMNQEAATPQVKALLRAELKAMVNELVTQKEATTGTKVAAKYQDANGNTWAGCGLKPKWAIDRYMLEFGASLTDFGIPDTEQHAE